MKTLFPTLAAMAAISAIAEAHVRPEPSRAFDGAWDTVNVQPLVLTPLTNGVPVTGLSAASGEKKTYTLEVPSDQATLTITLSGSTGDADLYVKFGSAPDEETYDCRPYSGTSNETCTFNAPAAGTWHVMIDAYSAYSGLTLLGEHVPPVPPPPPPPPPPPGTLQNGTFEGGQAPWALSGIAQYMTSGTAHGGTRYVLAGSSTPATGTISQDFLVPSSGYFLKFWLHVTTSETTTSTQFDKLYVEVRSTSGALLSTLYTFSNLNKSTTWQQKSSWSLGAWAGQTIRLQFRVVTDDGLSTTFRIDDVTLSN